MPNTPLPTTSSMDSRSSSTPGDNSRITEQEAKKGRYIPCIIKGNPPFPEGSNTVYLLEFDLETAGLLTPERLALNDLETQHCLSTPPIVKYYTDGRLASLHVPETAPSRFSGSETAQNLSTGSVYFSDTEMNTDTDTDTDSEAETVPGPGSGPETESESGTQSESEGEVHRGGFSDEYDADMSESVADSDVDSD